MVEAAHDRTQWQPIISWRGESAFVLAGEILKEFGKAAAVSHLTKPGFARSTILPQNLIADASGKSKLCKMRNSSSFAKLLKDLTCLHNALSPLQLIIGSHFVIPCAATWEYVAMAMRN